MIISFLTIKNIGKKKDPLRVSGKFTILISLGVLGTSVAQFFLGIEPMPRDFMFIPMILKYILIFHCIYSQSYNQNDIQKITSFFLFICLVLSTINIFQYWNFLSVNNWLTPMYFKEEVEIDNEFSLIAAMQSANKNFRVVGTLGNPNYVGALISVILGFVISNLIFSADITKWKAIKYYVLVFVILLGILLLQSRSSIIILLSLFFIIIRDNSLISVLKIGILPISILLISLNLLNLGETLNQRGFGDRLSIKSESTQTSMEARIFDFIAPLKYVIENPVVLPFGQGTSKSVLRTDSHNGFSWFLVRYGVLGLSTYISIFVTFLVIISKTPKGQIGRAIKAGGRFLVIAWVIIEFTGNGFKEVKLFSMILILIAVYGSILEDLRKGTYKVSSI
jgi:hypothetical protein